MTAVGCTNRELRPAIQTVGEGGGRISAVKTATATTNWQKRWSVAMGVGKTARPTWAIVWRDADGADQTALTLPVGRVISLFEPIMHGLQRQVCLALREGYRFRSSRAIDKTSRRYSRSQRYKSDGTGAGYRCRRRSHPKDCGRSSVWRFNALRSAPASERNACGCTCLASFRHSVTEKMPFRRKATRRSR